MCFSLHGLSSWNPLTHKVRSTHQTHRKHISFQEMEPEPRISWISLRASFSTTYTHAWSAAHTHTNHTCAHAEIQSAEGQAEEWGDSYCSINRSGRNASVQLPTDHKPTVEVIRISKWGMLKDIPEGMAVTTSLSVPTERTKKKSFSFKTLFLSLCYRRTEENLLIRSSIIPLYW